MEFHFKDEGKIREVVKTTKLERFSILNAGAQLDFSSPKIASIFIYLMMEKYKVAFNDIAEFIIDLDLDENKFDSIIQSLKQEAKLEEESKKREGAKKDLLRKANKSSNIIISPFKQHEARTKIYINENCIASNLFENFTASKEIPFLAMKGVDGKFFYKIYNASGDKQLSNAITELATKWVEEIHYIDATLIALVNIVHPKHKAPLDVLKRYKLAYFTFSSSSNQEEDDINENYCIFDYTDAYGLNQESILKYIIKSFKPAFEDIEIEMIIESVSGNAIIKNSLFDKTLFSHFIATSKDSNPNIFFDESSVTIVSNKRYSIRISEDKSKKPYTVSFIEKGSADLLLNLSAESDKKVEELLQLLKEEFLIYSTAINEIQSIYKKELGGISHIEYLNITQEEKIKKTKHRIDDLATSLANAGMAISDLNGETGENYSRKCQAKQQPYIIDTEEKKAEFEEASAKLIEEHPFLEGKMELQWNGLDFACVPRTKTTKNNEELDFIVPGLTSKDQKPCCFKLAQAKKGEGKEVKARFGTIATTINKPLHFGSKGPVPIVWKRIIKMLFGWDKNSDDLYHRLGMGTDATDTLLRAVLYASDSKFAKLRNEEAIVNYLDNIKTEYNFGDDVFVEDIEELIITATTFRGEPLNICIFSLEKQTEKTEFIIPPQAPPFDDNLDSIVIFSRKFTAYQTLYELFIEHDYPIIRRSNPINGVLKDIYDNGYNKFLVINNSY